MKTSFRYGQLALLLPLLLALVALMADPRPLHQLRSQVFDQFQQWHPRPVADVPVRIVDIDEASLAHLGQWPWPRTRLAELVTRLQDAGVAAIGFDALFAEPDRTSPARASQQWPLRPAQRELLASLPDHDQVFAQAIAKGEVVLGFVPERGAQGMAGMANAASAAPPSRARFIHLGPPSTVRLHQFERIQRALPALEAAAAGYGAISFVPDYDGVLRRVPLAIALNGQPLPTLASESLRVAQGEHNIVLKSDGDALGIAEVRIGAVSAPTTPEGEVWLHYSGPRAGRYLSAWEIIEGKVPAEALAGQIMLVGSSAQGLMDLRFNSLGQIMPGIEAHAQALEQILAGQFLQRPGWAQALETLILLFGGLLAIYVSLRRHAMTASAVVIGLFIILGGGSWLAFRHLGLLLDPAAPGLGIFLSFAVCSLYRHRISEREHRWIRNAFSRYVSPNRVAYLLAHPDALKLGSKRQQGSFIFTDLAGFTTMMESHDPAEITAILNSYLDGMIAIVFRHEGTLDRIIGDAVAVVFSAPVEQADHAARAYACALEMYEFASRFAAEQQARGLPFGHTRIGLHSGEVLVGNFGGSAMFDYRALGDAVNTSARLESVNKHLGTRFCVSAATLAGCPDAEVRPTARLVLKGRHQALATFEPLPAARQHPLAPHADYYAAYAAMQAEAPDAAARFAALAAQWPDDPLVALHHARLQKGETGDTIVMHEK